MTGIFDLASKIKFSQSIAPAAYTADKTGTGVDTQGFHAVALEFAFGAITDGIWTPKVYESDDDVTYTEVASTDLEGTLSAVSNASGGSAIQKVGYTGDKRYVQQRLDAAASPAPSSGLLASGTVVLGRPANAPTA